MSTEDINKVVVTLNKGVDVDAFIDEMSSDKDEIEFIRRVGTNSAFFEKEFK